MINLQAFKRHFRGALVTFEQAIGYLGSVLVALSMMMKNFKTLRYVNLLGASTMACYGIILKAYPVFGLNLFIVLIDLYYLYKIHTSKEYFTLNETFKGDEYFLQQFFEFYKNDIARFFPHFDFGSIKNYQTILIARDLRPVGFFIYQILEGGVLQIELDYACSEFRDKKNTQYVLDRKNADFKSLGVHTLISRPEHPLHTKFLKKVGFHQNPETPEIFEKLI
ncbi:MAG: hypothetical protein HOE90_23835 [Bacteriovoracaceae bacterium]|jgi:hypothetical protein|nr:hypothetical protein [Bacteriovoracaceae bacterium]